MNPSNLKTGDVLMCSSNRLISRLIKWATKSEYSHAAIFIEVWGQPFVMDAQKDGINIRPWDAWMNKYNYEIEVLRTSSKFDPKDLSLRAATKSGSTGYDFASLIWRHPVEIITGSWRQNSNKERRMTCSEFVAWVYAINRSYKMSPQDLYDWCRMNYFYQVII
jgi:uncharacterized protein YycO